MTIEQMKAAIRRTGMLTPIKQVDRWAWWQKNNPYWLWKCDCGNEKEIALSSVRSGHAQSCGCYRSKWSIANNTTHGHGGKHHSPEYRAWQAMRTRALNPNAPCHHNYGGRGITVCERWGRFENFLSDMGPKPSPGHSVERINNDGNYEPSNCKWATRQEQSLNRRNNHRLTHGGRTITVTEWAKELGIARHKIFQRIKMGWSIERILTP